MLSGGCRQVHLVQPENPIAIHPTIIPDSIPCDLVGLQQRYTGGEGGAQAQGSRSSRVSVSSQSEQVATGLKSQIPPLQPSGKLRRKVAKKAGRLRVNPGRPWSSALSTRLCCWPAKVMKFLPGDFQQASLPWQRIAKSTQREIAQGRLVLPDAWGESPWQR